MQQGCCLGAKFCWSPCPPTGPHNGGQGDNELGGHGGPFKEGEPRKKASKREYVLSLLVHVGIERGPCKGLDNHRMEFSRRGTSHAQGAVTMGRNTCENVGHIIDGQNKCRSAPVGTCQISSRPAAPKSMDAEAFAKQRAVDHCMHFCEYCPPREAPAAKSFHSCKAIQ